MTASDVSRRLRDVWERVEAARARVARTDEVTVVAVSKTVEPGIVLEAYGSGQRVFGENRVREAVRKRELLDETAVAARWHLLGHLQTNKAARAVETFDLIESVDSARVAGVLDAQGRRLNRAIDVLVEVNVAEEASKTGVRPGDVDALIGDIASLPNVALRGLMTVAPQVSEPEQARWVFARLRHMRDELRDRFALATLTELSMGMTDDFEVAIEEGATIVRVGRAIFGDRPNAR